MRLEFPEVDTTANELVRVLKATSVQPLQHYAQEYTGPIYFSTELQKSWK